MILMLNLSGCQKKQVSGMTLGTWITALNEHAGITGYVQQAPYYLNIPASSSVYEAVQAAVEYQILDPAHAFDEEAVLTREWTAYTLMNLSGRTMNQSDQNTIRDTSSSEFRKEIQAAVSSGLMKTDEKRCFHPKEVMDQYEALVLLDQVVEYLNSVEIEEPVSEIEWNQEIEEILEHPESFDPESGTAVFAGDSQIREGDVIRIPDDSGYEQIYQIGPIEESEEGTQKTILRIAEADQLIESMHAEESFDVDFSQAEIIDDLDSELIQEGSFNAVHTGPDLMSIHQKSGFKEVNGYKVSYSITSSGIKASVTKTVPYGIDVYAEVNLNQVRPTFRWKMDHGIVTDGYFRIDFKTSESLGAKRSASQNAYANLKDVDPSSFLASVRNAFKPDRDTAELTVPLCTVRIPVPNVPLMNLMARMELHLSADGRAELSLSQTHSEGMEIRNGAIRVINEHEDHSEAVLKATASVLGGIYFGLNMEQLKLADVGVEAGAKAKVSSTVHLYDSEGNHTSIASDLPTDLLSDQSQGNPDVLICGDMNAWWVMNLKLNSSGTLASKLGFSRTLNVLNESNGTLIPGLKHHMENFRFVDHCTRNERDKAIKTTALPDSQRIKLKDYSMIGSLNETKSISVTALPSGYSSSQLVYSSNDPLIASVDGQGNITGRKEGSTIIKISTGDGKYTISCSYLVRQQALS
jgi:hypothetical protein